MTHLYTLNDIDVAFNYFIKKIERIYTKCFPFESQTFKHKPNPWLTADILKSIKTKNELFIKLKTNPALRQEYNQYRNKLTMVIRNAKLNYHKNQLNNLKNNPRNLWSHINLLTETKNNTNIAVTPDDMNDFFTSIFKQAPIYNNKHPLSPTNDSYIRTNLFLFPVTNNEFISTFSSLSNLRSVGNDGLRPDIIKSIASLISPHLTYILNLSFSQGIFAKAT